MNRYEAISLIYDILEAEKPINNPTKIGSTIAYNIGFSYKIGNVITSAILSCTSNNTTDIADKIIESIWYDKI